ncbi:MAG: hypothetical protein F6K34_05195, partial [Okeania sp. SIO4D6]|nr:hypothetical protein [Okeania sp. SIO4D6]
MKINICTKICLVFAFCLGTNLTINNPAYARPKSRLLCEIKEELCQRKEQNVCTEKESCSEKIKPVVKEVSPIIRPNKFYCDRGKNGIPTTFVKTPQGTYTVIRWVSNYFLSAGYSPLTRCRQVSDKFQFFYDDGRLDYITTGIVNRQPVICVSGRKGGPCQGVLFTLKPQQSASETVQKLFDIRVGASTGPLYESGSRFYLNFNDYIEDLVKNKYDRSSNNSQTSSFTGT